MQESAWIEATLAGDRDAFGEIVMAYQRAVYNLAFRMLGNGEEAADAAQEVFVRAYTQLSSFDTRRQFSSWLLAIAAHHCIDLLRRRKGIQVELEVADAKADGDAGPEEIVIDRERRAEVRRLLDRLPPSYRLVVVLRYWYDMSCEEVARVSGISVGAAKTRLHRGRALIAQAVDGGSLADGRVSHIANEAPGAEKNEGKRGERNFAVQGREEVDFAATRRGAGTRGRGGAKGASLKLSLVSAIQRSA